MPILLLYPGGPPAGLSLGRGAVVGNLGTEPIIFSDTEDPYVVQGEIAGGAARTLTGTQFLRSAVSTRISIDPLPSPAEMMEERLQAVERALDG